MRARLKVKLPSFVLGNKTSLDKPPKPEGTQVSLVSSKGATDFTEGNTINRRKD